MFEKVKFPIFDEDAPLSSSNGTFHNLFVLLNYDLMLLTSTKESLFLISKLLKQGY